MNPNVMERFIGRDTEIQAFRDTLTLDGKEPRLLFLHGPGGIGKTWLLRRYLELAAATEQAIVATDLIDMYSTNNRYIDGVIASIISQIPKDYLPNDEYMRYQSALKECSVADLGVSFQPESGDNLDSVEEHMSRTEKLEYRLLAMREAFQGVIRAICATRPLILAFDTFESVQNGPVGKWLMSTDGIAVPGVLCLIASRLAPSEGAFAVESVRSLMIDRLSDDEALQLYYRYTASKEPVTKTLKAYISALNKRADGNPLLFGLASIWLTISTDNDIADVKTLGQEEFEEKIVSWLNPLDSHGSYHFGGIDLDEPVRQVLVLMAYLNRRFNRYFLTKLAENHFVKLGNISVDELWDLLNSNRPEYFYVKGRPEGEIQLHDKLAEMLRRYLFANAFDDLSGAMQRRFAAQVVDWYDELIDGEIGDDAYIQVLRAEKLAYTLRLDVLSDWVAQKQSRSVERMYRLLPPRFRQCVELLKQFQLMSTTLLGRLMVNDMRLPIILEFPEALQYECASLMGEIALAAYQPVEAVAYWQVAETVAIDRDDLDGQIKALLGQNRGLFQTRTRDAVDVLREALRLSSGAQQYEVEILYEMGYVHRRLEEIDLAVEYYTKALDKAYETHNTDWLPSILNDLGYAQMFTGVPDPVYNDEALQLRSRNLMKTESEVKSLTEELRLSGQGKGNELRTELSIAQKQLRHRQWEIGLTHNTLGQLYRFRGDLPRATAEYSLALALFKEVGDRKWEAEALYSRGEAHRRLAAEFYELGRVKPCLDYDERTYRDTDTSLDICERYNFVDKLATAYRRKGRLFHDRFHRAELTGYPGEYWLDQAQDLFDKGYAIASQYHQSLEEFENLTEKAFLGDGRIAFAIKQNPSDVDTEIRKAKENLSLLHELIDTHKHSDIRIYQYPVFVCLADLEDGALSLVQGRYDLALEKFLAAFSGLARIPGYGHARLRQHIPLLLKALRELDDEQRQVQWCTEFREQWYQVGEGGSTLADLQPELLRRIDLFEKTSFMYRRQP